MKEQQIGVGEAKAHLSEIIERVRGEEVIVTITRHGRPVACIVPVSLAPARKHLAEARGWLADDDPFFETMREVTANRRRHRARATRFRP